MLAFLKQSNRGLYDLTIRLIMLTIVAGMFVFIRIVYTRSIGYIFLIWNVFLAWLPLYFSLICTNIKFKYKSCSYLVGLLWIIFYPNAPYVLTDFIHLSRYRFYEDIVYGEISSSNFAIWYNFFLISIFIIIGLVLSYVSLSIMHKYIREKYNTFIGWVFVVIISVLSGFAIYLGRFVRINSWEIVTSPMKLIKIMISSFNLQALSFTALFGILTLFIYISFFLMNKYYADCAEMY